MRIGSTYIRLAERDVKLTLCAGVGGSSDKLHELLPYLIERVKAADRHVVRIVPTEPARPFFAWAEQEGCAGVAPPDGLEPPTQALGRPRSVH
jgi:hypothetical protein